MKECSHPKPYKISNPGRTSRNRPRLAAALEVYPTDVVLKRKVIHRRAIANRDYTGYVPPKNFSFRARKRMEFHLRNTAPYEWFATLRYPCRAAPTDGLVTRKHLEALRRRITKIGAFGVYKLEFGQTFQEAHFHLLISGSITREFLLEAWSASIGQPAMEKLVDLAPVDGNPRLIRYFLKDTSIPKSFKNVMHLAGFIDAKKSKAKPLAKIEGDPSQVAIADRTIRKLARRKGQALRGKGVAGCCYRGCGGEAVADYVRAAAEAQEHLEDEF